MIPSRILLVEDSEIQGTITRKTLEKTGYEVIWAKDGISALKAVVTASPDVVLLDLNLPDMSGTEICQWMKHNNNVKGIPIIMLTEKSSLDEKISGIEAGADDYLPKPYNAAELNARIYASLRTKALQDELRHKNKQLSELLAKVEALSVTDPLTGLYNRRQIDSTLDTEFKRMARHEFSVTCLLLDIDHFKSVNDNCGHDAGDSVLREIAQILRSSIREVDTAGRWGGEEFVVILPHTDKPQGMIVAERILGKVSSYVFADIPKRNITVSIGLAVSSSLIDTTDKIIHAADMALYAAKREGRNRVRTDL
ncbi:MAG: diguanylate cyclase [Nitrospirae bacterium]|nr:diguanylate cyclase [Nitrospirota bacterium]